MLPVAREFQTLFIYGTLTLVGVQIFVGSAVSFLWIPWLAFFFFIRDFRREIPPIPLANISPIDGVISEVTNIQDPFLNRLACRYTILQSSLGEFNLHSPTEGKVEQLWVSDPVENTKALVFWIRTDEQDDVIVHVELSSPFQHASTTLHPGERVGQGRRCGFVALGCKVHVYLPKNVQNKGHVGDRVIAGKNIIASFVH